MAEGVAAGGLTVVLSSHLIADMERVTDHLILLAASRVQLCGDIDELLAEHQVLVGPRKATTAIEKTRTIVQAVRTPRQTTLLVRGTAPIIDPDWEAAEVGLEEMVIGYMAPWAKTPPRPSHTLPWLEKNNDVAHLAPVPCPGSISAPPCSSRFAS